MTNADKDMMNKTIKFINMFLRKYESTNMSDRELVAYVKENITLKK